MMRLHFLTRPLLLMCGCATGPEKTTHTGNRCEKCGAPLFCAEPGITTQEDIQEFARHSKLPGKDSIIKDGWIHPGIYCPNGCTEILTTREYSPAKKP